MPALPESFHLGPVAWAMALFAAALMGFNKTGIAGSGILVVVIMGHLFEPKASTGIVLPLLCVGDVFAVSYYHRHADWGRLLRIMPWAAAGILIATAVGNAVPAEYFGPMMGGIVLVVLLLMIWRERRGDGLKVPDQWWFAALLGLAGGFATMIGNAAGPIVAMYLLAMRLPKYGFLGTAGWYYLVLNLFKVPFHIFSWGTITARTLWLDLALAPAVAAGALIGIHTARRIDEKRFRLFIQVLAAAGATKLLFA